MESYAPEAPVTAANGMVVGGHPLEAEAGVAVLREGGSAVDAVIAAAFVGFVVEPSSCGIGGYGRLAAFNAADGKMVAVDHYLRAPGAARPDMFEIDPQRPMKYYGHPHTKESRAEHGYLAAGVPGAVAGLFEAHRLFGRRPWRRLIGPAIDAADAGVRLRWNLVLPIVERLAAIRSVPATAAFLLRDGEVPRLASPISESDLLDTRELARTLRLIADKGAAGFHDGPVAEAIGRDFADHGGVLSAADLRAYKPRVVVETPQTYRGHAYITAYDQVGYEALNILECFDLKALGPDSLGFRHLMAEALACAFIDNMTHYGDPDFVRAPVAGLASKGFARQRAAGIALDRALPRFVAPADPWPFEPCSGAEAPPAAAPAMPKLGGTSQMVAADRDGNLAALCTSLSASYGALVYVPGTGVLMNNGMTNFDPRPGRPNAIAPGKMPIFAAPEVVAARDGKAVFAGAGSGGYRIETGVLHSMVHALDFGLGAGQAVDRPRVHCQGGETYVDTRIPKEVTDALTRMGHRVVGQRDDPGLNAFARVAAITVDPRTGVKQAGRNPAWNTGAAGY